LQWRSSHHFAYWTNQSAARILIGIGCDAQEVLNQAFCPSAAKIQLPRPEPRMASAAPSPGGANEERGENNDQQDAH
jgi:hypothetical protein